jgi:hypothetical protein
MTAAGRRQNPGAQKYSETFRDASGEKKKTQPA